MAPEPEEGEQENEHSRREGRSPSIRKGQGSSHGKDREQWRQSPMRHTRRPGEDDTRKGEGAGKVGLTEKAVVTDALVSEKKTFGKGEDSAGESDHYAKRHAPEQARPDGPPHPAPRQSLGSDHQRCDRCQQKCRGNRGGACVQAVAEL